MNRPTYTSRVSMTIMGQRGAALEMARGRIVLVSAFFILFYLVVAVRLFDLTIMQGELQRMMDDNGSVAAPLAPEAKPERRADLIDRNGVLLATSVKSTALFADPKLIIDPPYAAAELVKLFPNLDRKKLEAQLRGKSRYVPLAKNITAKQAEAVIRIGEPGLAFQREYRRVYPQGAMTSHIVGYTSSDNQGLAGVERSLNDKLVKQAEPVSLSIDVRLQHILRREMLSSMTHFEGIASAGLIMDANTGEILASASLPDFDPHHPKNPNDPAMFNRASLGVYEMGSTFKIFSTAAALEKQQLPMSTTFDASKPLQRGRFRISDYKGEYRVMTIPEIFTVSSNIGTALMAEQLGTEKLRQVYADLGLLAPPKVELEEVGKPLVPSPWSPLSTLTASYGHGIAVSPLQVVSAVATVVNGGLKVQPTLVKKSGNPADATAVRVLSPQVSAHMRQLLRLVVEDGTGGNADVKGYRVGGKTGTAEKSGTTRKGYDRKRLTSSFVGTFPVDDPKYIVFIMVDEPKGQKDSYGYATAGWVAAPYVGKVIAGMGGVLGLMPNENAPDIAAPLQQYVNLTGHH
jgi:cell division protein FtsI (penicillin-binding protein 3)